MVNSLPGIPLGRMGKNFNRGDIEALRQVIQDAPHINWQQFTSPPVEEPNCYVEVQVVSVLFSEELIKMILVKCLHKTHLVLSLANYV